jgi:hypothetical protein
LKYGTRRKHSRGEKMLAVWSELSVQTGGRMLVRERTIESGDLGRIAGALCRLLVRRLLAKVIGRTEVNGRPEETSLHPILCIPA